MMLTKEKYEAIVLGTVIGCIVIDIAWVALAVYAYSLHKKWNAE